MHINRRLTGPLIGFSFPVCGSIDIACYLGVYFTDKPGIFLKMFLFFFGIVPTKELLFRK